MAYQALYRRFRPSVFDDVVGQEHITTILKNQVSTSDISHAYLFSGSRGTGKTSTAKIFARAINCLNNKDGEPCGNCPSCIREENVDIIEIDAASNNGVDEIRELREKARFLPLYSNYKVYIIDEVHMLSTSAFNALLKTLEEPPLRVVFILATTEPQKLPATIISRCQRFEFHRIPSSTIIKRLNLVTKQTDTSIDPEGLSLIAHAADGSLRDALSLTDQCIAFCGQNVTYQDVLRVLGSMDQSFLFAISDTLIHSDTSASLRLLDQVIENGKDLGVFLRDLTVHFRNILLASACGECSDIIDCTVENMKRYMEQAKNCPTERVLRALSLLMKAESELKWLSSPRVLVESALVRICRPEDEKSYEALLDRLEKLESRLNSSPCQPPAHPTVSERPAPSARPIVTKEDSSAGIPAKPPAKDEIPSVASPAARLNEAESLWQQLLSELKSKNIMVYNAVKNCVNLELNGKELSASFPQGSMHGSSEALSRPYSDYINEHLLPPGMSFVFRTVKSKPKDDTLEKAALDLFGDKLEILND